MLSHCFLVWVAGSSSWTSIFIRIFASVFRHGEAKKCLCFDLQLTNIVEQDFVSLFEFRSDGWGSSMRWCSFSNPS